MPYADKMLDAVDRRLLRTARARRRPDKTQMRKALYASAIAEPLRALGYQEAQIQLFLADCEHPAVGHHSIGPDGFLPIIFQQIYWHKNEQDRLDVAREEFEAYLWAKQNSPQ